MLASEIEAGLELLVGASLEGLDQKHIDVLPLVKPIVLPLLKQLRRWGDGMVSH